MQATNKDLGSLPEGTEKFVPGVSIKLGGKFFAEWVRVLLGGKNLCNRHRCLRFWHVFQAQYFIVLIKIKQFIWLGS